MDTNKFRLLGKIKGLAGEISHLRHNPIKNKYPSGYLSGTWWSQKINLALKTDVRHHLLAYGFMKQLKTDTFPYSKLEQKCEIKPSVKDIVSILSNYSVFQVRILNYKQQFVLSNKSFTEEQLTELVTQWIGGSV